jgi:hypothetical protein
LIRVRIAFQTRNLNPPSPFKGTRPAFIQAMGYLYHEGTPVPASTHTPIPPSSTPTPSAAKLFDCFPVRKFYRGFAATTAGTVPYAGTSFLVWGFLCARLLPPRNGTYRGSNTNAECLPEELRINSGVSYNLLCSSPPARVCLSFVYPGVWVGPVGPGSDMPWGGDRVRPTGPPPPDDTIVGISRHHSLPLAFRWVRRAPSSHQYLLGGCPLVGNPLPRLSPLSDDRLGVPPLIFNPYVLFILYNCDFIDSLEK